MNCKTPYLYSRACFVCGSERSTGSGGRKRLLCDLDSIIVDLQTTWLAEYNATHNDTLAVEDILTWDTHLYAKAGHAVYEILRRPGIFRDLAPLPGAIAAVATLNENYDLRVVTAATFPTNYTEKVDWCTEHLPFLKQKQIVFAHDKDWLEADVLIDDGPHNAMAYRAAHPKAWLLGIKYPYNASCKDYDLLADDWQDTDAAWKKILEALK